MAAKRQLEMMRVSITKIVTYYVLYEVNKKRDD